MALYCLARRLGAFAVAVLICLPLGAEAQPAGKVPRVGVLTGASANASLPKPFEGLRDGLRELGRIDGRTIAVEYRFAGGNERLDALAAELVRLEPDVIVALGTPATAAVKGATGTVPIVMIGVGDPVGMGIVASLARPGGNVTGVTYSGATMGILAKQLELLREAVPKLSRAAILSNPTNRSHDVWTRAGHDAGRSLGVQIQIVPVRGPGDFDGAFAAMARDRVGGVLVMADGVFLAHATRLADLATKSRLPSLGPFRELVEAGVLMSYGPSQAELGRRAAVYVDRILNGARPADLPVEQPTKLDLVVNARTAKALGLRLPGTVLLRADHVIE